MSGWGAIYNNTSYALRLQSETLARLQEQTATGARVIRASDDPVDARRIMSLQAQTESVSGYLKNINSVDLTLSEMDTQLQRISQAMTQVHGYLTQAATGTLSDAQRKGIAEAVNQTLEMMLGLANFKSMGLYLFGGANTTDQPYSATRTGGKITSVTYQGSLEEWQVPVAPGVQMTAAISGDKIFRTDQREAPVFLGNTGAKAGAGTASARGDAWLLVSHGTTAYGGSIGLAAGDSSPDGDTILGSSHTLTVDATNQTLRLDDGSAVTYEAGETNVRVVNAAGEVVYVDVSGLTLPAGQQTVSISSTVKLSINNGASSVESDLTEANLAVTDSRDGTILYVDTTGIERLGTEPVRIPGTHDLFGTLITIRDLMSNERGLSLSQQLDLLNKAVASMDEVMGTLTQNMVIVGGRLQAAEGLLNSMEEIKIAAKDEAARLQDADLVELAIQIARSQNMYEMTLASASKLLNLSLLDFILGTT